MSANRTIRTMAALGAIAALSLTNGLSAHASSHREAPLIAQDPTADSTDFYAFVGNNDAGVKVLNVIANYIPFEEPGGGPNYYSFADDVRYEIHIENDSATAGAFTGNPNISYYINFKTTYKNPATFLTYGVGTAVGPIQTVGDARQNLTQTYTVTQVTRNPGQAPVTTDLTAGQTLIVPPNNIGHATPLYDQGGDPTKPAVQGATSTSQLDPYTLSSIYTLPGGIKVFAGQRYDSFFSDIAALFDLLSVRNPGKNTFTGYNINSIAMQIPVSMVVAAGGSPTVGLYTAASRRAVTVLQGVDQSNKGLGNDGLGSAPFGFGISGFDVNGNPTNCPTSNTQDTNNFGRAPFQQCATGASNAGSPIVTPVAGSLSASGAQSGEFRQVSRMANPLFNELFQGVGQKDLYNETSPTTDQANFGTNTDCPQVAGIFNLVLGTKLPKCGYKVLDSIFLPDLLKVDTSTGPVPLDQSAGFNRLSVFGGDTVKNAAGTAVASGWPNGRRLGDDVVDIAATAVGSGPTLSPLNPVGDNVNSNGLPFNQVFPFMQTPANGFIHDHVYP